MVDIITNRLFDTYNRFSPLNNNNQNESLATLTTLKRFSKEQKYKRIISRELDQKTRESQLFFIKENASEAIPSRRSFMGLSCQTCTMTSRESLVKKTTETLALRNILDPQTHQFKNGFFRKTFRHLYQAYEVKKFNFPQINNQLLQDEHIKFAVEKMTLQHFQDSDRNDDEFYQELLENNKKRAKRILQDMRSTITNDFLLRFTSWTLCKLLPCFLTSVVVHPGQIDMLKKAADSNIPIIFLPLHRSHLDYILLSFILLNNNIKAPLVAAGDNLRLPFFGSLLRGLGAFFIKRRIDPIMGRKDLIYKTILRTYMTTCLREGYNIEFFLEGGRTRTGKPCMPKYGILSVIVDTFLNGTIDEALLVPVSINYEKLVDGNFIREQLGQPKEMETFSKAMKSIWKVLNNSYGMMRVDFGQPFSLRELVKTFNMTGKALPSNLNTHNRVLHSNPSTNSLYGLDVVSDEHKNLVEAISKHVIYDCAQTTSVMSTNALAYLLLTKFRDGGTIEKLVVAMDELRKDLYNYGKDLGFSGDSIDVIHYAIKLLGPGLVRKERLNKEEVVKPIITLPNVIELTYYSNTVVTHFVLESIIAATIAIADKSSGTIIHQDLVCNIMELCEIMQYEFLLCKPCQNLEQIVSSCLEDLIYRKQIFLLDEEDNNELHQRSRRLARQFDEEDEEEVILQKIYKLNPNKSACDVLKHLKIPMMPYIECYSVTAYSLEKLIGRQLLENELLDEILKELKLQLSNGTIKYEESVSVDPIKNALKLFQKFGILECHSEKKMRLYYLNTNEDNSESVKNLFVKINKFNKNK